LRQLVGARESLEVIAGKLGRSVDAVRMKAHRLGLNVVVKGPRKSRTTTNALKIPEDLLTVEEALQILAAALKAGAQEGLDKVEVQRLSAVATLARTYKDLFVDYVNYREIEAKLVELEAKYEKLAKAQSNAD